MCIESTVNAWHTADTQPSSALPSSCCFLRPEVSAQLRIYFNAYHIIDDQGKKKSLRKEFSGKKFLRKEWLVFALKWKIEPQQ